MPRHRMQVAPCADRMGARCSLGASAPHAADRQKPPSHPHGTRRRWRSARARVPVVSRTSGRTSASCKARSMPDLIAVRGEPVPCRNTSCDKRTRGGTEADISPRLGRREVVRPSAGSPSHDFREGHL
jgi:hypothetical protein